MILTVYAKLFSMFHVTKHLYALTGLGENQTFSFTDRPTLMLNKRLCNKYCPLTSSGGAQSDTGK